ncbi:Esterase [Colletotrichum tropicale]|nr:Esterase [Colletotrichum tropicale]
MQTSTSDDRFPNYNQAPNHAGAAGLTVTERNERYFLTRVVQAVLKPLKPRLMKPKKGSDEKTRLTATKRARRYCDVTENDVEGVWTYDMTPKTSTETKEGAGAGYKRRVLYFGGGGWQMPPSEHHWAFCAELVRRLPDTRVTIISYPLAPKHPVSVAFPQIERVYKKLLMESTRLGERVIVAGDSSGGNIALCVVTWTLRFQEGETAKPPVAILAMSPTTDLRHEMEEIKKADQVDPIHTHGCIHDTAKTWCPVTVSDGSSSHEKPSSGRLDWSFEDPRVSPIQADLTYLVRHGVKVHGLTGSYDVLEPEAVAFRNKCKQHGVTGEWLSWHGQMHCFPLTFRYGLKASKEALDWIVGVLEKC